MDTPDLPDLGFTAEAVPYFPDWFWGPPMDWQEAKKLAAALRPRLRDRLVFVGLLSDDENHRIYFLPPTDLGDLVEAFRIGEHGSQSYGYDAEETITRVATRLRAIHEICPLVVTFADSAGLHADFARPLTPEAAAQIESLFPMDDAMQDGLESYISEWDGEGPLIADRLVEEQALRLWWD